MKYDFCKGMKLQKSTRDIHDIEWEIETQKLTPCKMTYIYLSTLLHPVNETIN